MARQRYSSLGGVGLLYDRKVPGHYGVTGVPYRPWIDVAFAKETDRAFEQLFASLAAASVGKVKAILSGGVGRQGAGSSLHHKNRAFDLDGLIFDDGTTWVADTFPHRPMLYLGIEAVLRQHFGTILGYDYNAAHEDHFHFDNGDKVGFKKHSRSRVIFLQNTLYFLFDMDVGRDGVYGPETAGAERQVRTELGIGGFSVLQNWVAYLETCVDVAFAREGESTGV